MVDETSNSKGPKTRALIKIPLSSAQKMKGWEKHQENSKALTDAREKVEASKEALRAQIVAALVKKKVTAEDGTPVDVNTDIDFIVEGDTVRIVEVLEKGKGRGKSQLVTDLF